MMVDPLTFRRINPNYAVSTLKPEDKDFLTDSSDDSDGSEDSLEDKVPVSTTQFHDGEKQPKLKKKLIKDKKNKYHVVDVPVDAEGNVVQKEDIEKIPQRFGEHFTDEEYLIASPVVLGFSFSDKLWLEITVSDLQDVVWDSSAWESLVLQPETKRMVKSLVETHERNAKRNIDDIIQG